MASCSFLLLLFSGCVFFTCTAQHSCKSRCGEDYVRSITCNCDYECLIHNECCKDYESVCTKGDSCKGRCGESFKRGRKCHCDKNCMTFLQCCPDYENYCNILELAEPEKQTGRVPKEPTNPTSQSPRDTPGHHASTFPPERATTQIITQPPSKHSETSMSASGENELNSETTSPSITGLGSTTSTQEMTSTDKPEQLSPVSFARTSHPENITTTIPTKTSEHSEQNAETNPQSTSEPKPISVTNAKNYEYNDLTTEQIEQSTSEPEDTPSTSAQANSPENTNPTQSDTQDSEHKPGPDNNPAYGDLDQNTAPVDKPGTTDTQNGDDFPSQVNYSNTFTSVEENSPTASALNDGNYQADENNDKNLCSGRPINGMTTLKNGTIVVFRGHYFWILDDKRKPGNAQLIQNIWGIPSPIDTVFTRCNCQGKTYFFKGNDYWRFENDVMDTGFPKPVNQGFGLKGHVIAALSMPYHNRRRESVLFFKKGGLAQKYTYHVTPSCGSKPTMYLQKRRLRKAADSELGLEINIKIWQGFPSTVTAAVSVPTTGGDGYSYYVFSPTKYYSLNIEDDTPAIITPKGGLEKQKSAQSWFGCPEATIA